MRRCRQRRWARWVEMPGSPNIRRVATHARPAVCLTAGCRLAVTASISPLPLHPAQANIKFMAGSVVVRHSARA